MSTTDWQSIARSRGLDLPEEESTKLGNAMNGLESSYQALAANLTHDVEPSTTIAEEAVEAR